MKLESKVEGDINVYILVRTDQKEFQLPVISLYSLNKIRPILV